MFFIIPFKLFTIKQIWNKTEMDFLYVFLNGELMKPKKNKKESILGKTNLILLFMKMKHVIHLNKNLLKTILKLK